jgi:hypothetical protein
VGGLRPFLKGLGQAAATVIASEAKRSEAIQHLGLDCFVGFASSQ